MINHFVMIAGFDSPGAGLCVYSFLNTLLTVDIILALMLWCDSAAVESVRTMGSVRIIRAEGCHRSGILFVNIILMKDELTQYYCDCKVVNQFPGSYTAGLAYDEILMISFSTKNEEGRRFTFPLLKLLLIFIKRLAGNIFFSLLPVMQIFFSWLLTTKLFEGLDPG